MKVSKKRESKVETRVREKGGRSKCIVGEKLRKIEKEKMIENKINLMMMVSEEKGI